MQNGSTVFYTHNREKLSYTDDFENVKISRTRKVFYFMDTYTSIFIEILTNFNF